MKWKPLRPAGGMLASACGWMGAGYGRAPAADSGGDPSAIISVSENGDGKALFQTGAAHGLITGQFVTIEGTEIYDGPSHEINGTPSATTFTTVDDYYAGSAAGTWTLE